MGADKPSGAAFRKQRRESERDAAERERERNGTNDAEDELLERVGAPPIDPIGNQRWANNLASAMAWITVRDKTIPRELRFKQAKEHLTVVGMTKDAGAVAARLEKLEAQRDGKPEGNPNGVDSLPPRPKAPTS